MEIFNCETLEYISFITQHNDWLIDICGIGQYLNNYTYVYITLGADNRLYLWSYNYMKQVCNPSTNVLIEDNDGSYYMYIYIVLYNKFMFILFYRGLCSSFDHNYIIVYTPDHWKFININTLFCGSELSTPSYRLKIASIIIKKIKFISKNEYIVYSSNGYAEIFRYESIYIYIYLYIVF